MYRLLASEHGGVRERRDQREHPAYAKPGRPSPVTAGQSPTIGQR